MYGWRTAYSIPPSGRGTAPSSACCNWKSKQTRNKASGHAVISPKCTATTLLEEGCPEKICVIKKVTLFSLPPTNILNVIDIWIVGL